MKLPHPPLPTEASNLPSAPGAGFAPDDTSHCLSALMDGQAWAASEATRQWRDDERARKTWHVYHLIGDVLRSDELARAAVHDLQFLHALNKRLASEPVVLAPPTSGRLVAGASTPSPLAPVADLPQVRPSVVQRQGWLMSAAALVGAAGLAGLVVVAGVWVAGRPGSTGPAAAPALAATQVEDLGPDRVIRDPRLEEFLRAHQAARSGVAAGVPGSALRSAGVVLPVAAGQ